MFETIINIFREYPALAIFLTVGIGFFVGRLKIGRFSLGSVTSVLLVGVVIGQMGIPISGPIKNVFFMMFLFSIGYSVGPDFFRSLKGQGLKQALFAIIMSCACFGATFGVSKLFGYTKGETVGLFSGSQTCSSLLGVGSEAIQKIDLPEEEKKEQLAIIPVCYAVTYVFGTFGTVILLGNLGPSLLGGLATVRRRTLELEEQLGAHNAEVDVKVEETEEERKTENSPESDLMFLGLTIFVGGLFGALTLWVDSIPLSFGTSGGALIAGLVFGWLRSRKKKYGHISSGALWLMNNLGLNVFIATVALESATSFMNGIREAGVMLLVAGVIATLLPLLFGLFLGHKVFRFNPAITLGCCAGTRTCTASLGAVQETIGSTVPTMGYTVTYAVSNIMLVIWGLLTVILV